MDFNITGEEDALLLRIDERLTAGDSPSEDELAEELGNEARDQLRSLAGKGWLVLDRAAEEGPVTVRTLTPLAQAALSNRRDVGE
ncbi:hypothetical protein ACFU99_36105 [Streptomyces sp. NPDC057654]|uniref:hypothetical protein n=1 Tax=Streptomyces sp. NPDC057654 TaxID=3346196 RepID=UPI00369D1DF5